MTAGIEENHLVKSTVVDEKFNKAMNSDTCCITMEKGIVVDDMRWQCECRKTNALDFSYLESTDDMKCRCEEAIGMSEVCYMGSSSADGNFPHGAGSGFPLLNYKGIPVDSCSENGQVAGMNEFKPMIRSGVCSDQGIRQAMEDEHVCIDDLSSRLCGSAVLGQGPKSCYGVFDGHGGRDAAEFARDKLLDFIVRDISFPSEVETALHHAYLKTDKAFAEACISDDTLSSGTTAIMALVLGRKLLVANAGDCRAVLSRRGKAVDLSRDHKPFCVKERTRIEALGGYVDDGYLNGQLGVARALGDWHMDGLKGVGGPLSAEPDVKQTVLSHEDEFLIIGCDGLWDVFSSQLAIDFARRRLQQHNDPERCCQELVAEALRRDSGDNLTVIVVCFQPEPPPRAMPSFIGRKSISSQGLRNLQSVLDNLLDT